jgi:hemolysin III
MFGVLWGLCIAGVTFKNIWIAAPRWLSAGSYILMGWMAVVCVYPLALSVPLGAMMWLLAGGVAYTLGGVIYALKWPSMSAPKFGFHEYFHVLCLIGSICHYVMMYMYILKIE